jgi:hypothetical protein
MLRGPLSHYTRSFRACCQACLFLEVGPCHAINHSTLSDLIIMSSGILAHDVTSTILYCTVYSTEGIASSIASVSALRGVCSLKAHFRRGQVTGVGASVARSRRMKLSCLCEVVQMICSISILEFYRLQRTSPTPSTPSPYWQPVLLPGIWSARGTCMQARMLPHAASRELEELGHAIPTPSHAMPAAFSPTLTDV